MVKLSELDELKPVGGSSFGGHFAKEAFAAYIFPRGKHLERDGTQKLQRREGREINRMEDPYVMQTADVAYTMGADLQKPCRLRRAVAEQRAKPPSNSRLKLSESMPEIGIPRETQHQEIRHGDSHAEYSEHDLARPSSASDAEIPVDAFTAALMMNSRWYPHPCLNRGTLKLTGPAALAFGVDPLKDVEKRCPFYDAPKHRFKDVQSLPEARLRTPDRARRWLTDDAWNNPANHAAMKVTLTLPPKLDTRR